MTKVTPQIKELVSSYVAAVAQGEKTMIVGYSASDQMYLGCSTFNEMVQAGEKLSSRWDDTSAMNSIMATEFMQQARTHATIGQTTRKSQHGSGTFYTSSKREPALVG